MLSVKINLGPAKKLKKIEDALIKGLPGLMQAVGVKVSTLQRLSFEDKSRGGGGADGKPWKPLTQVTERLKQTRVISKTRKGDETGLSVDEKMKALKKRRAARKKSANQMGPFKRSQIGVDKGLLRSSITPGFTGPDGKGGNLFRVAGNRVLIGYRRSYADYFDRDRPLFPNGGKLLPAWQDAADQIARDWVEKVLKESGGLQ